MCRKVVWLMAGLMGLVWLGGVAEGWAAGTPKLRLSVAPGAQGVVRGHGTHGTDGTDRGGLRITRHASGRRRGGVGRGGLLGWKLHARFCWRQSP